MTYLLTIYGDESGWGDVTPEQGQAILSAYWAFSSEVKASGAFIAGEGLQSTSTATTVRVRDGERVLTDGPSGSSSAASLSWSARIWTRRSSGRRRFRARGTGRSRCGR
jgi:hypothetical protein